MNDGVNYSGKDMYPVMPRDFYAKLTREDINAIFAYLRTLKPVRNQLTPHHLDFPFNQRWLMAAWRELYFTVGTFKADAAQTPSSNRGAYLVEGLGHCSDCHSPRNIVGAIEK
jgi:mono/diheme cytochrome c family protein